jgi:hypothetical protein
MAVPPSPISCGLGGVLIRSASADAARTRDRNLWVRGGGKPDDHSLFNLDLSEPSDPEFQKLGRFWRSANQAVTLWPDHDWRPDVGPHRDEVLDAYRGVTRRLRRTASSAACLYGTRSSGGCRRRLSAGRSAPLTSE